MPETDLGAVIQNSDSQVDVEVLAEAADVNSMYEEAIINLKTRKPVLRKGTAGVVSTAEKEQAAKDYYAGVRTNVCHFPASVSCVQLLIMIGWFLGFIGLGTVKCSLAVDLPWGD